MNDADKVLKAFEKHGWTQGRISDDEGRVCMQGACIKGQVAYRSLASVIVEVIKEQFPDRYDTRLAGIEQHSLNALPGTVIVNFNDHPETKFEDVQLVLEKTSVRLDETV